MTHSYTITGLRDHTDADRIHELIVQIPFVEKVEIHFNTATAVITMKKHIMTGEFNKALHDAGYLLKDNPHEMMHHHPTAASHTESKPNETINWKSYYPLILVFSYIILLALLRQCTTGSSLFLFMSDFMGGFFVAFSFFKLLDIPGFAAAYSSYDIITKKWLGYGYLYPFIELFFGLGFLFFPAVTGLYIATLVIMSLSIIGVIQSVVNKREIRCACLGTVFNLPMGTITIIEDGLMIAMSILMLMMKA